MSHFEMKLQLIAQFNKQAQQRHRIRPAGDRDENAVAGRENSAGENELKGGIDDLHFNLNRQLPGVSGHLDVTVAIHRLAANFGANLCGAFPVGHARASVRDQFLLGKCRGDF